MTSYTHIGTKIEARQARLTLKRPPLNIFHIAMMKEMADFLTQVQVAQGLCVLLIVAEGPSFSAGVDIPEHGPATVREMLETFHACFRLLRDLPCPTLCAVQGGTYGGGLELAVFCDIVLAADDAKLGVPEIKLGVFPPLAVAHLARRIGYGKAAELIYTGTILDAHEALRIGLVNHVFPAKDLKAATAEFVAKFTSLSAFSLARTKEALGKASLADFERSLQAAEEVYVNELMKGEDPSEGLAAFMEKRPPRWKHR